MRLHPIPTKEQFMKKVFAEKKQIIIFGAIVLIAVIAIAIVLSSGSKETITGTYRMVDASGSGSEMLKATVKDAKLEIRSDDTGTLTMFDQETPVTVDTKAQKISFDGGENYTPYKLESKKLTIENGGNKIVFRK